MTTKSKTTPVFSVDERAEENHRRLSYARRQGHLDFIKKADLCTEFLFSDQWEKATLELLKTAKRPALTVNKIKPIIKTMLGEYIANRTEIKFVPAANGTSETAELLNKILIDIFNDQKFAALDEAVMLEGGTTSRAYFDVRMAFDENYKGKVVIGTHNPRNVIPDPDADDYDPDTWNDVIVVSRMTLQDIIRIYGKEKVAAVQALGTTITADNEALMAERDTIGTSSDNTVLSEPGVDSDDPKQATRKTYLIVERQYKTIEEVEFFVNKTTGERARVPVDWDQGLKDEHLAENSHLETEKKEAQVIRWTTSTGAALLHNSLSPFDHFTVVPFFPFFLRGNTSGWVEDLIDPQRNYNKLRSQELHIVNGTSNSGWKVKSGALVNMTRADLEAKGSMTGLVIEFSGSPDDIQRIEPVKIPTGLDRISEKADRDLGDISGIQDEARGVARADVAGKAIAERRQSLLTALAPDISNMIKTHTMLAQRILKLVQKYYDDERKIAITTSGVVPTTEVFTINQVAPDDETGEEKIINDITQGDYNVVATTTAARNTFENQEFQELVSLRELGVNVPPALFVEYSTLSRKEELVKELSNADMTEEERQQQREEQELMRQERIAKIKNTIAQAQLSEARAQKVLSEINSGQLTTKEAIDLAHKARELDLMDRQHEDSMEVRRGALNLDRLRAILEDDRQQQSNQTQDNNGDS